MTPDDRGSRPHEAIPHEPSQGLAGRGTDRTGHDLKLFELAAPGPSRDRLVAAVLAGRKIATSALLVQYEDGAEPLPETGERRVLVDSANAPVAVIELLDVSVVRLGDVDLQLAVDEGEDFATVQEWRDAHEAFWNETVLPALRNRERWPLDDDTQVVVERFRLIDRAEATKALGAPTQGDERASTSTEFAVSADGTQIGYRHVGSGPGLVVLHGSMSSGHNHIELAQKLADEFTVILVDRRGRGGSGPYTSDDTTQREAEDLHAVLDKTGARNVFGVSVGGIIALQAALNQPAIRRLAVYEPPLFPDSDEANAVLRRFDEQMAEGRVAGALATAMKGARLGPGFINVLPHRLLELMTRAMLSREDKKGAGEYVPFRQLAPTLHYETALIAEVSGGQERLAEVHAEVLLLGGSRSSRFLKAGLGRLEHVLPNAQRVELPGLDHSGSWNADRGGKPARVAAELRRFFTETRA